MHRFLRVINKAGKKLFLHILRICPIASRQEKHRKKRKERMHEAIEMHIRGLVEDGLPVPKSHSSASFVAVQT